MRERYSDINTQANRQANIQQDVSKGYAYKGFVDDAKNAHDYCAQIEEEYDINAIRGELEVLSASTEDEAAKAGIDGLIDRINEMHKFLGQIKDKMGKKNSAMRRLIANKYNGDDEAYKNDVEENLKFVIDNNSLFYENKEEGNGADTTQPRDMRQILDDFHKNTQYDFLDEHEELFKKVDSLFDAFSGVQFQFIRMNVMQETFDSNNNVESFIDLRNKNKAEYRKIMKENPDYDDPADMEKDVKVLEKRQVNLEKAYKTSEKKYLDQQKVLDNAEKNLSDLENKKVEYETNKKAAQDKIKDCEKQINETEKSIEILNTQKATLQNRVKECEKTKLENENKVTQLTGAISEKEKQINDSKSVLQMKVAGLEAFRNKLSEKVMSSNEIIKEKFIESVNLAFDDMNRESQNVVFKYADLDSLIAVDKTGVNKLMIKQSKCNNFIRGYDELLQAIESFPPELAIDTKQYNLKELKMLFQEKYTTEPKYAAIFGLTQMLIEMCPDEYKNKKMSEINTETILIDADNIAEELSKGNSVQLAEKAGNLQKEIFMLNEKLKAGGLSKEQIKDINRQIKTKQEALTTVKKNKEYVKGSDKVFLLNEDINRYLINEQKGRKKYREAEKNAEDIYKALQIRKSGDLQKLSENITGSMSDIIAKLPQKYDGLKKNLTSILGSVKGDTTADDMQNIISEFERALSIQASNDDQELAGLKQQLAAANDAIQNMEKEITESKDKEKNKDKAIEDANKKITSLRTENYNAQEELKKWDYDKEHESLEKIRDLEKQGLNNRLSDMNLARTDLDKNTAELANLRDVSKEFGNMYSSEGQKREFESNQDGVNRARKLFLGSVFIGQMQSSFKSFYRNRTNVRKEKRNSDSYQAMDEQLTRIISMNENETSAEDYISALNDLKAEAQRYIEAKKKQHFHWIPSKLRKFRLKYAQSLIDTVNSQLNALDSSDYTKINEKVELYLEDLDLNPEKSEAVMNETKETYLKKMAQEEAGNIELNNVQPKNVIIENNNNSIIEENNIINTNIIRQEELQPQPSFDIKDKEKLINPLV